MPSYHFTKSNNGGEDGQSPYDDVTLLSLSLNLVLYLIFLLHVVLIDL